MGGLGSGRRGGWGRKKVEASRSIDVNELIRRAAYAQAGGVLCSG
jgi:hypothetical protein